MKAIKRLLKDKWFLQMSVLIGLSSMWDKESLILVACILIIANQTIWGKR